MVGQSYEVGATLVPANTVTLKTVVTIVMTVIRVTIVTNFQALRNTPREIFWRRTGRTYSLYIIQ
jgi:hypothetical protein